MELGIIHRGRVCLVGRLVGLVLCGGIDYGLHLWRDRAVRSVAVDFVEAECRGDRPTLK